MGYSVSRYSQFMAIVMMLVICSFLLGGRVKALVGATIGGEDIWQNIMRHLVLIKLASQILVAKMLSGNGDIRKPWDSVEDIDALILQVDMPSLGKDDVKGKLGHVVFIKEVPAGED
ncbi:hypothetical protein SUGI_0030310 [Cryptomeria japonica]|nr:hypothetical protein SUGI_0030310 [Cryptomeria japonica]